MKGAVKLNQVVTTMDRDLVLYVQIDEPNQPRMISEVNPIRLHFLTSPVKLIGESVDRNLRKEPWPSW